MIYNKSGDSLEYKGKKYTVGEEIYTTNKSIYKGMFGIIKEIRTGKDRETDNPYPDIYCSLDSPPFEAEYEALKQATGNEDVSLDMIIMAPEMIVAVSELLPDEKTVTVYALIEDCTVDFEDSDSCCLFTDIEKAKLQMRRYISKERKEGCIERWRRKADFIEEKTTDTEYVAYIDGRYCQNHYCVSIVKKELPLPKVYVDNL